MSGPEQLHILRSLHASHTSTTWKNLRPKGKTFVLYSVLRRHFSTVSRDVHMRFGGANDDVGYLIFVITRYCRGVTFLFLFSRLFRIVNLDCYSTLNVCAFFVVCVFACACLFCCGVFFRCVTRVAHAVMHGEC